MRKVLLLTSLVTMSAVATTFPSKNLEIVTHSGAGGGTDLTARMTAKLTEPLLGKSILIVNKRGGGGVLSLNYVASRPADGHTILTYTSGQASEIAKGHSKTKLKDWVPIARATDDPQILMVKCNRFTDVNQFLESQKKEALTYGTTHLGGIDDVSAFAFTTKANLKTAKVIPFESANEVATQIVAGGVDVGVLNLGEAKVQIEAGQVCPIVVLADNRMKSLPNIPTAKELGIPVSLSTVRGFVVKSGTPEDVVEKLEKTLLEAMAKPEFQKFLANLGLDKTSVAGKEIWGRQLAESDKEMHEALKQLGFIQ
ncbi:tripartite tricarboxylate transporter substrate binding protein [Avibacterium sp. 21-586]|uniref:Bug family tripartite tricarboxylate transporter substrate binding protein n=1 Tax=Avibacterium sp. 21-586 TaxID=2911534 RepID=UPI002247D2DE|nr:tripartite tricarboxylate transporter substrate binding protein [Avibacterium sp. 21-586]MCW9710460.1 tripartite tricarboxylate transporter substrate binding protein [Avibacterium sp. 21-586]